MKQGIDGSFNLQEAEQWENFVEILWREPNGFNGKKLQVTDENVDQDIGHVVSREHYDKSTNMHHVRDQQTKVNNEWKLASSQFNIGIVTVANF